MGFVMRSAIGLGAVYYAMFAQAPRPAEPGATTSRCASAVASRLTGGPSFAAQMSAAGCAAALAAAAERLEAPPLQPTKPTPAASEAKAAAGTLTAADLRDPWFGPTRPAHKAAWRG